MPAPFVPQCAQEATLRILTFTTLFPSAARPRHGIFVETRLRKLVGTGNVDARVVAPVPWFPFRAPAFGEYAHYANTPRAEARDGIFVLHPRYAAIPKVGMRLQPDLLCRAATKAIERLLESGFDFDVIDAHYFYPDGVAAAALARRFDRPFVVTARGSDINLIAQMRAPRERILAAAGEAAHVIAVSAALKDAVVRLGVNDEKVSVLRNGVDLDVFRPVDRTLARRRLGLGEGMVVASVGNLVAEKGHDLVLRASALLPSATVLLVGEGNERRNLSGLATSLGMSDRVRFLPVMPQADLAAIYCAADVLALGSTREGWPNVLLEAMACGTPVVSMAVGGVLEILADAPAGAAITSRQPREFASALLAELAKQPSAEALRSFASRFGWETIAHQQLQVLATCAAQHSSLRDRERRLADAEGANRWSAGS